MYERLNAISIPVADQFVNIVDKTATILAYGCIYRNHQYIVRQMPVKINNNTFCKERIIVRCLSFSEQRQMCGSPLKLSQRFLRVFKLIILIIF